MVAEPDSTARPITTHARTDRQSLGRSVDTTPESLYVVRIAVLEAQVDVLQTRVATKEHDIQHVIDRYEAVLDERAHAHRREIHTDDAFEPANDQAARPTTQTTHQADRQSTQEPHNPSTQSDSAPSAVRTDGGDRTATPGGNEADSSVLSKVKRSVASGPDTRQRLAQRTLDAVRSLFE